MPYVWTGHKPLRRNWADNVHEGEEFEPTEDELQAFGDHIAFVEPEDEDDGAGDTGGQAEDTDEFDAEEWLDQDYEDRLATVEAGEVDVHLETIVDVETSTNVEEAAEERLED